jgi:hypothetical protein
VKGTDPKSIWETVGIYRTPNEDVRVIERLAARAGYMGNCTKRSTIGGDLKQPCADWDGNAECISGAQAFINRLVWENGYIQVADCATRGDTLLDVCLVRPESSFNSCSNVQELSDHCEILLEVEWGEKLGRTSSRKFCPGLQQNKCLRTTNLPAE